MKNYTVLQDGIKECGSACLLSIIKYYGGNISINRILELTNTNKDGTNFYNISLAAHELGLTSTGYKINDIVELHNIKMPFISQVVINNLNHFIVVYKIKKDIITIMDPAKGMTKIKLCDFLNMFTGYILTFTPYQNLPIYKNENYIYDIINSLIRNNKKIIIFLIIFTILAIIFTSIYSYYLQICIDIYLETDKINIINITIIFIIILFIKTFSEYHRTNLLLFLNKKIDLSIILTTINKIIFLPYSYYKNKTSGDIISRINDLFFIKNIISRLLIALILDLFMSLITLIILFKINIKMTLFLLAIVTIYILIFFVYRPYIKKMTNITQNNNSNINSLLIESVNGYNSTKGLNLEKLFIKKIGKVYQKSIDDNLSFSRLQNDENTLISLFEELIILFITLLGITYIMDKSISIGSLITYITILYYFINPIKENIYTYNEIYYVKNSIKRINNLLNISSEEFLQEKKIDKIENITINNLTFTYNNTNEIIKNISLHIKKGEKVLLLGKTGCGKSTLLKILYKYYNVGKSMILMDNNDINNLTLNDIRENISYLSQDEIIYTDTIKNNIILDRDIIKKDFDEIVKITNVEDIINSLNISYDHLLLENGANLSGGQKQRIILARTLLSKRSIYLIDEGLNQIDASMERKILKSIFNYYYDKTFIIVSHRNENIDLYDHIIKLDNGRVFENNIKSK